MSGKLKNSNSKLYLITELEGWKTSIGTSTAPERISKPTLTKLNRTAFSYKSVTGKRKLTMKMK
jgi:hypothetical protein